ncbi:RAD5B [Symbiodinium microadriaticum]|nr:RAD5B [Symbiodinium microadriaticum]
MGAPPAQLVLLREVVGAGLPDDALASAWQRSGGDLAAAVNLLLDAPATAPARPCKTIEIELDDSDGDDLLAKPVEGKVQLQAKPETSDPPPKKRRTSGPRSLEASAKPARSRTCNIEWSMALGSVQFKAWSTVRLGAEQRFPTGDADGSYGPLLCPGRRLELRWAVEAKKSRARPGTASSQVGAETGTIRFDACGQEVGRFAADANKTLVPLLARRLIDVEAVVGRDPPRALDLGTDLPVVVRVSLRSVALRTPGQSTSTASTVTAQTGQPVEAENAKSKSKGQNQKAAADSVLDQCHRNFLHTCETCDIRLKLPCRRRAAFEGDVMVNAADEPPPKAEGGMEEEPEEEEEMSRVAAAQLGRSDQLERHDLPGIVLPSGIFETRLRPYQAQAVFWMWQRENPTSSLPSCYKNPDPHRDEEVEACASPKTSQAAQEPPHERQLHPMWDEYELPEETGPLPGGKESTRYLYYHRTTGALSLDFPDAALAHCRGGILADDMGLGKTVMCLALTALDFGPCSLPTARKAAPELRMLEEADSSNQKNAFFQQDAGGVGGVLVVAPLSLIRQWFSEAQKHFFDSAVPSIHEFHGSGKNISLEQLRNTGIVLTTYNTLASQPQDSSLFQVYWRRIILDEAHSIKNRCSRQAQAAFQLRGFCRWCVTGTPLQNSVEELYSTVRFLRVEPWCAWPCWRKAVAIPLERGRHGDPDAMTQALDTARRIVTPLILRRTKSTVNPQTGEPLLKLPMKHVHVQHLELSPAERDFYDTLWRKAKTEFDTFVEKGEVLSKYTHILQLIGKLRQALCHPFLVFARAGSKDEDMESLERRYLAEVSGEEVSEAYVATLLQEIRNGEHNDCAICYDTPQDPTLTPCGHIFCRECCYKIIKQCHGECPVCRKPGITRKSLKVLPGASSIPAHLLAKASASESTNAEPTGIHSTKMKELLKLLHTDMAEGHRAVVFSQWTSFLELIERALDTARIQHRRFDGSLSLEERAHRVAWLSEPAVTGNGARVLLAGLKSGGTGLNLVAASRLYLLDLWWNPAVEEQAIQRVHRIGQKQEVHIYKFVVEDTIDCDLLQLHRAKERLLEDALSGGKSHEVATRLTMDDLKRLFNPCRSLRTGGSAAPAEVKALAPSSPAAAPLPAQDTEQTFAEPMQQVQDVPMTPAERGYEAALPQDQTQPEQGDLERHVPGSAEVRGSGSTLPRSGFLPATFEDPAPPLPPPARPPPDALEPVQRVQADVTAEAEAGDADMPQADAAAAEMGPQTSTFSAAKAPTIQEQKDESMLQAVEPHSVPMLLPDWEAAGDALGEGLGALSGGCGGLDEDDISDSELLAACHAAEEQLRNDADTQDSGTSPQKQQVCRDEGSQSTPCWSAMPLDV